MTPILFSEKNSYNEDTFKDFILKECERHRTENRALIFAFIVYNFANPEIAKILKDDDYLRALDEISGKYISVFYIDSKKFTYHKKLNNIALVKRSSSLHCGNIKSLQSPMNHSYKMIPIQVTAPTQFMVPVGNVNNFGISSLSDISIKLQKIFTFDCSIETPFVLFFQTSEMKITDSFIIRIKSEMQEPTFQELKKCILKATESLKGVDCRNYGNVAEIFNLVKDTIKTDENIAVIQNMIKRGINIISLISTLRSVFN